MIELSKLPDGVLFKSIPNLELATATKDPLTLRKEIIYEGNFDKDGFKFSVDSDTMDYWKAIFDAMQQEGVEVYVPDGHEYGNERHGTVVALERETDSQGRNALFADIKFKDEKSKDKFKDSQVSIYVPKEVKSGKGTEFKFAIEHVAITDKPVIPGLDKFQSLAASFTGELKVPQLCENLMSALSLESTGDEEQDHQLILAKVDEMLKKGSSPDNNPEPPESREETPTEGEKQGEENKFPPNEPNEEKKKEGVPMDSPSLVKTVGALSHTMKPILSDNRKLKLEKIRDEGRISKAVYDDLVDQYCSDEALTLSLEDNKVQGLFDSLVETLQKNPSFTNETSGPQAQEYVLSKDANGNEVNPLHKVVENRRKEYYGDN